MKSQTNAGNPMCNSMDEVIHVTGFLNAMGFKGKMFGKKKVLLPSSKLMLRMSHVVFTSLLSVLCGFWHGSSCQVSFPTSILGSHNLFS